MLSELSKKAITVLARLERSDSFVYRQAETFALVIAGLYVCNLSSDACKELIDSKALIEIGNCVREPDLLPDETDWVYAADPCLFGPAWVLAD